MALLTPVQKTIAGTTVTLAAAAIGGDTFEPGEFTFLVRNAHATLPRTVTVVVPGNAKYGGANADVAKVVPALGFAVIGPFADDLADPADGLVHVTYSDSAADLTRVLIRD